MGVQAPEGHLMPDADIDSAVSEREELDLDCCGMFRVQIMGEGVFRLDQLQLKLPSS